MDASSLFITADSRPLFGGWFASTVGAAVAASVHRFRRGNLVFYLGACNGDDLSSFQIFEAACRKLPPLEVRHLRVSAPAVADDMARLEDEAALIVLAGSDVRRGWQAMCSCGLDSAVRRAVARGAVLLGVSAGAVLMGSVGHEGGEPFAALGVAPFLLGAHAGDEDWRMARRALASAQGSRGSGGGGGSGGRGRGCGGSGGRGGGGGSGDFGQAVGVGILAGGAAALSPDGTVEPFLMPLVLLCGAAGEMPGGEAALSPCRVIPVGMRHCSRPGKGREVGRCAALRGSRETDREPCQRGSN